MPEGFEALSGLLGVTETEPSQPRERQKESWDKDYNPATDAVVLRLYQGSFMVSPGLYRFGPHLLDANGCFMNPEACPECGTEPGGPDYRFQVRVLRPEHRFQVKPVYEWTYCRRCVSESEYRALKAATPSAGSRGV